MLKKIYTTLMAVLLTGGIFASGFQINEHGARAMAMGGAFTGLANDASAAYFNSAGITQLTGTHFSLGGTLINPSSTFTGPKPSKTESKLKNKFFTPFTLYVTHQLNEKLFIGFAFNSPFGLGTEWEDDWVGRYNALKTEIRTFNFTPVISYKIADNFSAGFGLTLSYADVEITRKLPAAFQNPLNGSYVVLDDGSLDMTGDAFSYGFNASIFYQACDELSFGASFKSQIRYEFEGDAKRTFPSIPAAYAAFQSAILAGLSASYPYGNISAPMTVPHVFTIGTAYRSPEGHTLTADFQYNAWESYEYLTVDFKDLNYSNTSVRKYQNSWIARIGGEFKVDPMFDIRVGVYYDKNPIKDDRLDFTLPDADRIGISAGTGIHINDKFSIDLAYLYLLFMEREINSSGEFIANPLLPTRIPLNGTYNSYAHLVGLNFSYNL